MALVPYQIIWGKMSLMMVIAVLVDLEPFNVCMFVYSHASPFHTHKLGRFITIQFSG